MLTRTPNIYSSGCFPRLWLSLVFWMCAWYVLILPLEIILRQRKLQYNKKICSLNFYGCLMTCPHQMKLRLLSQSVKTSLMSYTGRQLRWFHSHSGWSHRYFAYSVTTNNTNWYEALSTLISLKCRWGLMYNLDKISKWLHRSSCFCLFLTGTFLPYLLPLLSEQFSCR